MAATIDKIEAQGALSSVHVRMADAEAVQLLQHYYALDADVRRLDTEKDDTFRVDLPSGEQFILKASNPSEDVQELAFQTALLRHVAAQDPGLPTPRPVPGIKGDDIQEILDAVGQRRHLRLMTYLAGTPLDSVASSAPERTQIGETLARLRLATADFEHPGDRRVYAWDVQHLLSLRPLLEEVRDGANQALLAKGMTRFAMIAPDIAGLPRQVLHNDFSKSNIIVAPGATQFVTGIIDFGDAVRTAVAIDVATALLSQLPPDAADRHIDDLFLEGRPLLKGYLSVAPLTHQELRLIPHLVMGRVIARALLTLKRAELFPANQWYILRNTEQGWGQLRWFLERTDADISSLLV